MTYDSKCYDLAATFLGDCPGATEKDMRELATLIQTACEGVCSEVEERHVRSVPPSLYARYKALTTRTKP